jgi:hypothetical protein
MRLFHNRRRHGDGGVQHPPGPRRGDARGPPVAAVLGGACRVGGWGMRRTRAGLEPPPRRPLRLAQSHLRGSSMKGMVAWMGCRREATMASFTIFKKNSIPLCKSHLSLNGYLKSAHMWSP